MESAATTARGGADISTDQQHLPAVDRIAICVAGLEAQEFFRAPTHEQAGFADLYKVIEIIEDEGLDPSQAEGLVLRDAGYVRARELIAANEDACRRVAARLIESGRVGAAEFSKLMRSP